MAGQIQASASPEKRLFISLLTRDIPLSDAFLDLIDNSLNSVLSAFADKLKSASDYASLLNTGTGNKPIHIKLQIGAKKITISDNSTGISLASARDSVFKFGRATNSGDKTDRLSVYGVGLKRAIFKMGNKIDVQSDHKDGGFSLDLNVSKWETDQRQPWVIDIDPRPAIPKTSGTKIEISQLYPEVVRRVTDGLFIEELRSKIQRTYEFFLNKVVKISVNDDPVLPFGVAIGENTATDYFKLGSVTCNISAGIGVPDARGNFVEDKAGWSVFCNGRAVVIADKTFLTGWIGGTELPLFQPKHRPFVGLVFFVSSDPEMLPWTTTKSAINRESEVWQEARRRMVTVGKEVTSILDRRYSNDGTGMSKQEVKSLAGTATSGLSTSTFKPRKFEAARIPEPEVIRIQFDAKVKEVDAIRAYLRRSTMSGSDVGRHTFSYFLKNRANYDD